jgi:hypothetical protein
MTFLARPPVALGFGAFFLCAATCAHFDTISPSHWLSWPLDDWAAGAFLISGGVLSSRNWTSGRPYQIAGWAFIVSLLFGSFLGDFHDWVSHSPDATGTTGLVTIPEGPYVAFVGALFVLAVGGLVSSLRSIDQPSETWRDRPIGRPA